jgi:hypothetical protein
MDFFEVLLKGCAPGVVLPRIAPHIRLARLPQKWVRVLRIDDMMGQARFLAAGRILLTGK